MNSRIGDDLFLYENIDVLWTDDILKIYINEEKAEAYTPNFNK